MNVHCGLSMSRKEWSNYRPMAFRCCLRANLMAAAANNGFGVFHLTQKHCTHNNVSSLNAEMHKRCKISGFNQQSNLWKHQWSHTENTCSRLKSGSDTEHFPWRSSWLWLKNPAAGAWFLASHNPRWLSTQCNASAQSGNTSTHFHHKKKFKKCLDSTDAVPALLESQFCFGVLRISFKVNRFENQTLRGEN